MNHLDPIQRPKGQANKGKDKHLNIVVRLCRSFNGACGALKIKVHGCDTLDADNWPALKCIFTLSSLWNTEILYFALSVFLRRNFAGRP